jgi:outer membrane protein OmpA-like peptidoglycan-associated protein
MSKVTVFSSVSALILSGALVSAAVGQTASTAGTAQPSQTIPAAQTGQTAPSGQSGSMSPSDSSTYATGKPLEDQSKEGFWGHMNPFARKKWVKRQVDPIKDRTNELDQLQAKNANDIRDVDSRAQAGINHAMSTATTADQHAMDARNRADAANGLATDASNRTTSLNGTVSNLDQYQTVAETAVPFVPGRTVLGPKGKAELDDVASKLSGEKGYIIEVEGYSRGGVQTSQAMADAVVRYLVTEHQVPIYRIYRTGMGKNEAKSTDGEKIIVNGVRVSLMHNSLATMGTATASNTGASNPAPMPQ